MANAIDGDGEFSLTTRIRIDEPFFYFSVFDKCEKGMSFLFSPFFLLGCAILVSANMQHNRYAI